MIKKLAEQSDGISIGRWGHVMTDGATIGFEKRKKGRWQMDVALCDLRSAKRGATD